MSYLEIKNFSKSFGGLQVLKGINVEIEKSEVKEKTVGNEFFYEVTLYYGVTVG